MKHIGEWKEPESPFDSSKPSVPMYHGVPIDFCSWCGEELVILPAVEVYA